MFLFFIINYVVCHFVCKGTVFFPSLQSIFIRILLSNNSKINKNPHKNKKSSQKIWWLTKNSVPLHPQIRNGGSVAQLNRASDYGSEGCGFESRRNHEEQKMETESLLSSLHFSFFVNGLTSLTSELANLIIIKKIYIKNCKIR